MLIPEQPAIEHQLGNLGQVKYAREKQAIHGAFSKQCVSDQGKSLSLTVTLVLWRIQSDDL